MNESDENKTKQGMYAKGPSGIIETRKSEMTGQTQPKKTSEDMEITKHKSQVTRRVESSFLVGKGHRQHWGVKTIARRERDGVW